MKKTKKTNKNNNLPATKKKMGRPSKYLPDVYPSILEEIVAENGVDNKRIARSFKVSLSTIEKWLQKYPDFLRAIKKGKKRYAQAGIEVSFRRKAEGFHYEETEVIEGPKGTTIKTSKKYHPPDTAACIYHLKVWDPENWAEKKSVDDQQGPRVNIQILGELSIEQLKAIQQAVGATVPEAIKNSH
jgi:hypothetical protein